MEPTEWLSATGVDDTIRLSVTRLVRGWASLQFPNYGVLLAIEGSTKGFEAKELASGEKAQPVLRLWTRPN